MKNPAKIPKELQDAKKLQIMLKSKPESFWVSRGEKMALKLFQDMSKRVPAYKDFLKKNAIDSRTIKTMKDFQRVPTVDKDNYLRQYSRQELCWDGNFATGGQWVISTTSGSTGEPFYFPRTSLQDEYYAITAELYLRENFQIQDKTTLYIDAFAMGAWIGGIFTYEAINRVAQKGYNLSVITPGINKAEVINNVRKLGPDFDQVIIGCYPPIMKDIIDLGVKEGLDWSDFNLGIVFSAEGFSEEFRDYMLRHGKMANPYMSTLNHYGTVDLGTMSHETPLAIMARRQAIRNSALFEDMFGHISKQPTFTQYLPELFFFEEANGHLLCSSYSGIPLVRYDLKDNGGIVQLGELEEIYKRHGKDLTREMNKLHLNDTKWNLPFVYLFERSDFSVTFTGAQIYPEEIRRSLLDVSLEHDITGKFTMLSGYDKKARNYLEINVELKPGIEKSRGLTKKITDLVVKNLLKENSEYRVLYGEYKSKLNPKIKLWPNGHHLYFSGQGKQKWVKKD